MLEARGVHIVLVLAHADALGVNLDEFGQRVGQSAANADGAAHRHVVVGELLARQF